MPYINIDQKNIYYEIYGEGNENTLLYFHGGPGASCLDYQDQAAELGKYLKVIIFDQYGVLRSDSISDGESYGMDAQLNQIEQMRQRLGIKDWNILGHSYGGMLAVRYSQKHPSSVKKIVLECPSLWFQDSAKSIARYCEAYFCGINNKGALLKCKNLYAKRIDDNNIMFDLLELLGCVDDAKVRNYLNNISFEEYFAHCHTEHITDEMWQKSSRHINCLIKDGKMFSNYMPILKTIHKPILLINGRYDPVCSQNQIEYTVNEVDNLKHIWFESSGHCPHLEEFEKYTSCVVDFLL